MHNGQAEVKADGTIGDVCLHHFHFQRLSKAVARHPLLIGICLYCSRRYLLTEQEIKELYEATTMGGSVYRWMNRNSAHTPTKGRVHRPTPSEVTRPLASSLGANA